MIGKSFKKDNKEKNVNGVANSEDIARNHFLNFVFEEKKEDIVLDLGCGDLEITKKLAEHFKKIIAIDKEMPQNKDIPSIHPIQSSKILFYKEDFTTTEYNFLNNNIINDNTINNNPNSNKNNTVDIVTASFIFHLMDRSAILKTLNNVKKKLNPGSKLFFIIPHPITFFASFGLNDPERLYKEYNNQLINCTIINNHTPIKINYFHHTITDYLNMLNESGFTFLRSNCKKKLLFNDSFKDQFKFPNYLIMIAKVNDEKRIKSKNLYTTA